VKFGHGSHTERQTYIQTDDTHRNTSYSYKGGQVIKGRTEDSMKVKGETRDRKHVVNELV